MEQPAVYRDPKSIGVGSMFTAGISAAFRNFPSLLGAYALLIVPMMVVLMFGCPTILKVMTMGRTAAADLPAIPGNEWIVLAGVVLFGLGIGSWTWATIFRMADTILAGEPCPSIGAAYGNSIDRVPAVIGTYICVIALTLVGAIFCFLPGIYVAIALNTAPARAATRGRGPLEVIPDVFALTKGRWWRVCGYLFLGALSIQAIYLPLSLPGQFAMMSTGHAPAWYFPVVMSSSALLGIFQIVWTVALHRRLEELGPLSPGSRVTPPPIDDTPAPDPF